MAEHAEVNELEVSRLELAAGAERYGGDKVHEDAESQHDLDGKQRREAAFQRVREIVAILPGHGEARSVEDRHDERHDAAGAPADSRFHRSHGLAPHRLTDAFEDNDLEEDGADEHDGGKKMQGDENEMAHDRRRLQPVTAPSLAGRASAANFASTPRL
ncbi:MAG: hypothetical protein ACTHOP_24520 [Mesorhizobium sp.]